MRAAFVMSSWLGSRIAFASFGPACGLGSNRLLVGGGNQVVEGLLVDGHDLGPQTLLDFVRRLGGRRAASGREKQDPGLPHHGDHPQQTKRSFEFVQVAAGQERDRMTLTLPAVRIHPIMTAGRQREDEQRMLPVENRLHHPLQGEALQVDGEHRRGRPRFLQQGRGLLDAVRFADQQFDVSQLLLRLGQAGFHGFHLLGIGVPPAVLRSGGAGEDDADPRFPRGLGGDSEAQACVQAAPASIKPLAATPVPRNSRLVQCSHIGIPSFELHHALTDQKSLFERIES